MPALLIHGHDAHNTVSYNCNVLKPSVFGCDWQPPQDFPGQLVEISGFSYKVAVMVKIAPLLLPKPCFSQNTRMLRQIRRKPEWWQTSLMPWTPLATFATLWTMLGRKMKEKKGSSLNVTSFLKLLITLRSSQQCYVVIHIQWICPIAKNTVSSDRIVKAMN